MKEYIGYIYLTTNKLNDLIYVGKHHGEFDKTYHGSGNRLKEAMKGKRHLFFTQVLCWCKTEEELKEMELYWIDKLDALNPEVGYNVCKVSSPILDEPRRKRKGNKKMIDNQPDRSGKNNSSYGKIWIAKGNEQLYLSKEDAKEYLSNGWVKKNLTTSNSTVVSKDGKNYRIKNEELSTYLSNGYTHKMIQNKDSDTQIISSFINNGIPKMFLNKMKIDSEWKPFRKDHAHLYKGW